MGAQVWYRQGGKGGPTLMLLHGLGATAEVWDGWLPLLAEGWPGRWVAPDLPGHGRSAAAPPYSFDSLAAGVAPLVDGDDDVVVLGHSLGGVLGMLLAGPRSGVRVSAVLALGVKVAWTADELARAAALAGRPVARYATRAEAAARYLRVSGLVGLVSHDDPGVDAGLRQEDGLWRLSMDPSTFAVGEPDVATLIGSATGRVVLARGQHDPMVSDADLTALGAPTVTLPGLGHNAHVEDPAAVLDVLLSAARRPDGGEAPSGTAGRG